MFNFTSITVVREICTSSALISKPAEGGCWTAAVLPAGEFFFFTKSLFKNALFINVHRITFVARTPVHFKKYRSVGMQLHKPV
jgi:hypothetical protein